MRRIFVSYALLLFSLAACSPPPAKDVHDSAKDLSTPQEAYTADDEVNVEARIEIQARVLFEQKKFEELNQLARHYLVTGERTPTGEAKLKFFYVGLVDYAGYQTPSQSATPNVDQWNVMFDRVQEWIAKNPSPPAYITLAKFHHHLAWLWRGDGFAGDVSEESWKPFNNQIAITRSILADHKDASVDPEWFVTMENVSRAQSIPDQEASAVVAEAIGKHKYYERVYEAAVLRLMPNWGGSWDEVEQFADFAAENTKDKYGDALYTRIYMVLGDCGCGVFSETRVNWSRMKNGFEEIVKRYPNEWNLNSFAYYACQARDRDSVKALFAKINRTFMDAWNNDQATYESCKVWASQL